MGVECPKCHFDNPSDSKFCKECGAKITSSEEISAPTETLETPGEQLTRGTTFAGRYEIIEELGKGGMGKVYRVTDKKLNEEVALKLIKPEIADDKKTIKRFRNELKLARKITHKNVCRMFDFHEEKETPYITMEYVKGKSLKDFIRKKRMLPEKEAIDIIQQVGRGLSEAHEIGVVHRDLKPQNIMIDKKGNAKVMDFGIAHSLEAKGVTQTGVMIGTPDYMSPEQAEAKRADQRSDIYSLGIILYEMVTGKLPFVGDTALSVALMHKTEEPLDPRELNDQVSEDLSSVILRCLEKSREERFQNVGELLSELRNIDEGMPLTTVAKRPQVPAFLVEGAEEVEEERPVFVARDQELSELGEFLDKALSGKGQVVFVKGEAGCGKTALVQEFARRAQEANSDLIVASGNCNAHTGIGDPYLPFREVLALLTGEVEAMWKAGALSSDHAQRLWHCLPVSAQSLVESGPELINTFIAGRDLLERAESYVSRGPEWFRKLKEIVEQKAAIPADPMLQQSVLFQQYARVLETLAGQKPLFLILDDLQWADAGSTSLLMHLIDRIQSTHVLIVGAYRPEEIALDRAGERHPLKPVISECKTKFGDIEVEIGKEASREFVYAYLDTEPNKYSSPFREAFHRHTQGHSLFTIEVLRGLKEQGALVQDKEGLWKESDVKWEKLPTRVEAMIGERIDRLPENLREVLKMASIEGEYFTGEVLAGVQKTDEKEMVRLLSGELDKRYQLVSAQGIRWIDGQRLSQYRFRHILFQKYLYGSLDEVERAHLHEDVGTVLEKQYGQRADEIAAQLVRHFQEAGIAAKAIEYLEKAGNKAAGLCANEEAVAHFQKGLEILKTLPDTPERVQQELGMQLGLAVPLSGIKGYGDPAVGKTYSRVRLLCQKIGEKPQLITALFLLSIFYFSRAEHQTALEIHEQLVSLAQKVKDPLLIALTNSSMAWMLYSQGRFVSAQTHLDKMNSFYDFKKHGSLAFIYGFDPGMASLAFSACNLWCLGYPDQALDCCIKSVALARKVNHPYTLAFALAMASMFNLLRRESQALKELAEELVQLSREKGFLLYAGIGNFKSGRALCEQGQIKEGIARINQGLAVYEATGQRFTRVELLACLAEAYGKAGEVGKGLELLSDAFILLEESEECYFESTLYRLRGELMLMKGVNEDEVERDYQRAIDVARGQSAKSWELRATMSLARLWQKQGKKEEALRILKEIYEWFTEGFDTPDLKDAKALLKELS